MTLPVSSATVSRHAAHPVEESERFGFCDVSSCDVVYVAIDGTLIRKDQVRTRVGIKEAEDPVPVCYCFAFTARQIREDLVAHGKSTIREYIQRHVRAGRCQCNVMNPSGRCCLGNVARVMAGTSPADGTDAPTLK